MLFESLFRPHVQHILSFFIGTSHIRRSTMNAAGCKMLLIASVIALCSSAAMAQSGKITGVVRDQANSEPIVSANVILDGTSWGAAADANGIY
jgi:hypothetical protein